MRSSIRWKLVGITSASLLLALALICVRLAQFQHELVSDLIASALETSAEITDFNCRSALSFRDSSAADETLRALRADAQIAEASLYAADGTLFAAYRRTGATQTAPSRVPDWNGIRWETESLLLVRPILLERDRIGTLLLRCSLERLTGLQERSLRAIGLSASFALMLAIALASWLLRGFVTSIQRLAATMSRVTQEGDYAIRAPEEGQDEVAQLNHGFNRMLTEIQQREIDIQKQAQELRLAAEAQRQAQDEISALNRGLEKRVEERTAELEAANRELEAFSYSVSHDLRAPLRSVDGFSRIIQQEYGAQLPEVAQEYLRDIRAGAQDMGRLIEDLLAFSRLGRQPLHLRNLELRQIVQACLDGLRPDLEGRKVSFVLGELPACQGDSGLLKQVFMNLLANALKYSRKKESAVIEIGPMPSGDDPESITVFVKDNGVGFDMRYAKKLFGVFQRLHRAEEYEGTGVGLATVQRIVHRHGGKVWAEAILGEGATFFVSLKGAAQ